MNLNLLGIDFEEWYHPQLVKPFVNHMKHEPKIIKGIETSLFLSILNFQLIETTKENSKAYKIFMKNLIQSAEVIDEISK